MRLGIDFGTTRIVVAAVDRGNYPVVRFETPDGVTQDWYPPLIAVCGEERRYGWEAWALQGDPEWTIVRSLKRLLKDAGPQTQIRIAGQSLPMHALLRELTAQLRRDLLKHSTLSAGKKEAMEIYLGVPANANSNQRFLSSEGFRQGGFEVLGLLNEPSAASIEYSHYHRTAKSPQDGCLLVYDLGGGTFDAALVELGVRAHEVLGNEGISTLGGDDFDVILAEMTLDQAGIDTEKEPLSQAELFRLHEECRQKKEALHPNSRKIVIDLECIQKGLAARSPSAAVAIEGEVSVSVADFYERCRPLVAQTLLAVNHLLAKHGFSSTDSPGEDGKRLEAVYVAGGGSELPLIPRGLREQFGRRVRRSAHARSTTAIGLAIQADASAGYAVRERFTRYFGVWREAEGGKSVAFDPLFEKETPLPLAGEAPLAIDRLYSPVHNIGHFRYLESSQITEGGEPSGEITLWDEIRFPFEPSLESNADLEKLRVRLSDVAPQQQVEEAYRCDSSGTLTLTITNRTDGYSRCFQLGRWAGNSEPLHLAQQASRKQSA